MTVGLIPSGFKINVQQALFPLPYGCKHEQAIKRQKMGIFLQKHSKPYSPPAIKIITENRKENFINPINLYKKIL